jgi:hypothetical protein
MLHIHRKTQYEYIQRTDRDIKNLLIKTCNETRIQERENVFLFISINIYNLRNYWRRVES